MVSKDFDYGLIKEARGFTGKGKHCTECGKNLNHYEPHSLCNECREKNGYLASLAHARAR